MQLSHSKLLVPIYADTERIFTDWSLKAEYRPYTNPPSMAGEVGFAIFYTPAQDRPELLIIGQNPSDFSSNGDLSAEPNGTMLSRSIPTRNSLLLTRSVNPIEARS